MKTISTTLTDVAITDPGTPIGQGRAFAIAREVERRDVNGIPTDATHLLRRLSTVPVRPAVTPPAIPDDPTAPVSGGTAVLAGLSGLERGRLIAQQQGWAAEGDAAVSVSGRGWSHSDSAFVASLPNDRTLLAMLPDDVLRNLARIEGIAASDSERLLVADKLAPARARWTTIVAAARRQRADLLHPDLPPLDPSLDHELHQVAAQAITAEEGLHPYDAAEAARSRIAAARHAENERRRARREAVAAGREA
jgi:hypothetical protein